MAGVAQRVVRELRKELFDKLQALSLRTFDQHPHGDLMSCLSNDVETISNVLTSNATQLVSSALTIVGFMNPAKISARVAQLFNVIPAVLAGAERVFEILDEEPELTDAPDVRALDHIEGKVTFEDVCFGYEPGVPVLKHVTMYNNPGEVMALVGPTGGGKTTIINLLTRFYDVDSGAIRIDGVDIRDIEMDDLRRKLGLVLQDNFLFADTVMENIRYGRLDAIDEEVIEAARLANAHSFIRRLPQGYRTELSERGGNPSLGQRQLLAIVRAVLADPDVLILDEATSNVNSCTEKQLEQALMRLMEGRTSFVIAHRLSTIRDADCVMVIKDGEIVERGTHEELLEGRGFYHQLYTSQFKGQAVAPGLRPA
jgi:ATP-binding cassette subfamily B protein